LPTRPNDWDELDPWIYLIHIHEYSYIIQVPFCYKQGTSLMNELLVCKFVCK
jgi:hypothetical protein